ncbi:MAG: hypothetical protein RLZZ81_1123 [Pseudomonadota bacterium]|jgi:hypothetical protein
MLKDKNELESLLKDRYVRTESEFVEEGYKERGNTSGYVAKDKDTEKTYILKEFKKDLQPGQPGQYYMDRVEGITEFISGTLFERLLYDRAPRISLVKSEKHHNSLYVSSKFFESIKSLAEFGDGYGNFISPSSEKLQQIKGFEKVIAACHLLGEIDYHAANLMVQSVTDDKGKSEDIITKIDHGKSFIRIHKDFGALLKALNGDLKNRQIEYIDAIENGNLKFNVTDFSTALKQMLEGLDIEQANNIIDKKVAELKEEGLKPQIPYLQVDSFESLSDHFKHFLATNLERMKDISEDIQIVANFTNVDEKFKNGRWVSEMVHSGFTDPISFASDRGIKINNQEPLEWAQQNNYKIKKVGLSVINNRMKYNVTKEEPMSYIINFKNEHKLELSKSEKVFLKKENRDINNQAIQTQPLIPKSTPSKPTKIQVRR